MIAAVLGLAGWARAGTATNITGLYYSGIDNSGGLLSGGSTDPHWNVTYASTNGGSSQSTSNQGAAYVVSSAFIDGAWTQNTSSAQWITAPGATNGSGTANVGGGFLPGNGNTGSNKGIFVYTLALTVTGNGSGNITNSISISLTISADDQYRIYVNPSGNGTTIPTGTAAATATNAWNNSTSVTLQNGTNGTNGNAIFKIGTNYLTIVVDNTNSVNGSSSNNTLNPSGLLVYQVGSAALIDGKPIPEVGAWLPIIGAVGLYGAFAWRRRRTGAAVSI
ncbi:MAG: hypothetical protein H7343_03680 [Undibacterium sp.]|nr:hypothetical protein [Opitutaceae bacterium]